MFQLSAILLLIACVGLALMAWDGARKKQLGVPVGLTLAMAVGCFCIAVVVATIRL